MGKGLRKNYYRGSILERSEILADRLGLAARIMGTAVFIFVTSWSFIVLYDFLTQCDYFRANRINIEGECVLSDQEAASLANVYKGINILSVNLSRSRKRLLSNPWIIDAEIRRELPDHITIKIKEHEPLAILDLGRKFLIDAEGEIFKELSMTDPVNLPVIIGLVFSDINVPKKPRSMIWGAVMEVLQLGRQPGGIISNSEIRRIIVDREIGITIIAPEYESGRIRAIKLGFHDFPGKLERLQNVVLYLKQNQTFIYIDSIDLINLDRIVVNPVRTESNGEVFPKFDFMKNWGEEV